ncbi:MAG: hypothetical protein Q8O35_11550 [Humidesulfovibrio sp.]|jgi:hypothetical protein|uniref:hypothetical protein n=1 Tax=Humidesulfovibrio sp. TaxID=2910988 RepID=UPI0027349E35|nr:hypothetical protein [Humidesulfovibrio sp.]MDP2848808.1 hypothetical protein [Humidesulfovibrio sp.]
MTIATQTSKAAFSGNGVTTAFPLPFPFMRAGDIKVLLRRDGFETALAQGQHYTVAGAGSATGGSLTLANAPATGQTLVAYRAPAIVQEVDYVENSAFPAETHEAALDLLTMICQSLQEQIGRAVLYPVSTPDGDILNSEAFLGAAAASRDAARISEQGAAASAGKAAASASAASASAGEAAQSAAIVAGVAATADGLVKVSSGDAMGQSLSAKLLAGNGLSEGIENPGGVEALRLAVALAANPGLEFDAGLLRIKAGAGLALSASGLAADVGTTANKLLQLDAQGRMPAVVGAYTRQQYAVPVVLVAQSGSIALDADLHQDIDITATGAITLGAPANAARGKTIFMTLYAASALAIAWNAAFKPNADNALDATFAVGKRIFLNFRCVDGANWLLMGRVKEA